MKSFAWIFLMIFTALAVALIATELYPYIFLCNLLDCS